MKHLLVQVYSPTNAESRGRSNSVVLLLVSYSVLGLLIVRYCDIVVVT